ncbi:MAG: ferredoxin [Candidatus Atelocyanobacterium thalassa isolate SIO64986]|uniref:Ferredoxin n=1 Tax=Candidatus Atelocyanobacterium thalassa isolate SIO64986 TaxID=1527444 RepID=A0A086CG23_9CHRO|nr:MAG: ferredoxin [Candidatus Atelocyanobacterium thalassa isolate SIO64986]
MKVQVTFLPDNITIEAEVGEPILEVAKRAGIKIPTGCLMGYCHACEIELEEGNNMCACISSIPSGTNYINIILYPDTGW